MTLLRLAVAACTGLSAALLAGGSVGCHVGVPPASPAGAGVHLSRVEVAAAEPGLADALRSGLGGAFASHGLASGPTPLTVRVLEASTTTVGATGLQRVHRARLSIELQLLGPAPRAVVLSGERGYGVDPADGLAAAQARAAAFQALADQLAQDALLWLSYAPDPTPPP